MSRQHLLPDNRTKFETALSEALDFLPAVQPYVEAVRGFKFQPVRPDWLGQALVFEYGLGDFEHYFNNRDMLIAAGIAWQRLMGTPLGIASGLSWLNYTGIEVDDQHPTRLWWTRYQIGMGRVPEAELPILLDAEYLAGLSDPVRSVFFRGWHGYDFRALDWSNSRWGDGIWGDDSGARVDGGTVKWSHGEDAAGTIVAGEAERVALGVDVHVGDELDWGDFPWDAPGLTWDGVWDAVAFKAFLMLRLPVYVGFYDAEGEAIGYRRPLGVRNATAVDATETVTIEVECRTGFGDGEGRAAASCALVFHARPLEPDKPGKLWLEPDEIAFEDGYNAADMTIGSVAVDFLFRRTVRQHVTLTLDI